MERTKNLYEQLVDSIVNKIKIGEYKVGEAIPSERKLCLSYDVSRITVRKAIEELEKRGFVERRYGSGTYVSRPTLNTQLSSFYSFSGEMRRLGYTLRSTVIHFSVISCPEPVRLQLGVAKGEKTFLIRRLREVNNEPIAVNTSYIPIFYCPDLNAEIIEQNGLYNSLMQMSDIVINVAQETFEAVQPSVEVQKWLSISTSAPMLRIDRLAFADKQTIEYCEGYIRGDRYKYSVLLK
jgi:GntR family transcriptional regulator